MLYYAYAKTDEKNERDAARELLFSLLKDKLDFHSECSLEHEGDGSPYLLGENGSRLDGIYISISHSGGFCAAAVSDTPVGIDIERIRSLSGRERSIERRFLSDVTLEKKHADSEHSFFFKWTYAEAMFKCKDKTAPIRTHEIINDGGSLYVLCVVGKG